MNAVILAAGCGSRLGPLTQQTNKTLLEVGGKSILARMIEGLISQRVKELIIVTGHCSEKIKSSVTQAYPQVAVQWVYNANYACTNNIVSLSLALEQLKSQDDLLLLEADLVFEANVLKQLLASPFPNTALLAPYQAGMDGTVVKIKEGKITSFYLKHLQTTDFDYSNKFKTVNIYKLSAQLVQTVFKPFIKIYSESLDPHCYYEAALAALVHLGQADIYAEVLNQEKWIEVDDACDLAQARFLFGSSTFRQAVLETSFGGFWSYPITDFAFMKNPYFPPSKLFSELQNDLSRVLKGYGSRQRLVDQKLAEFLSIKAHHLVTLNGASQIYPIFRRLVGQKKVLLPSPTFGEYERVFAQKMRYADAVGLNWDEIEQKAKPCQWIVFVNPNNPTGSILSTPQILEFAASNKTKTILIDESFIDFSDQQSIITLLEETSHENVLVLKSLSKAWGMPGLRLGFLYSHNQPLLDRIREEIPIWNINSLAERFLELLPKYQLELRESLRKTKKEREKLARALGKISLVERVYPSQSSFLLVRLKKAWSAKILMAKLLSDYSIFVKDVSGKFREKGNYLRFAVGNRKNNQRLLEALQGMAV